jgi:hypothetical protein
MSTGDTHSDDVIWCKTELEAMLNPRCYTVQGQDPTYTSKDPLLQHGGWIGATGPYGGASQE